VSLTINIRLKRLDSLVEKFHINTNGGCRMFDVLVQHGNNCVKS
jgi:hypothetical protein